MSFISLCSLLSCADPSDRILVVLSSLPCEHYLNKSNICWSPPHLGHAMTMHCVGGVQVTRCAPGATCDAGQSLVTEATPAPDTGLVSHLSCPGVSEHNISVPRQPSLSLQTAHITARLQHAPCVSSSQHQPIRAKCWGCQPIVNKETSYFAAAQGCSTKLDKKQWSNKALAYPGPGCCGLD